MAAPVYLQRRYLSNYGLLSSMADELAQVIGEHHGTAVRNLEEIERHDAGPGIAIFFNFPQHFEDLPKHVREPGGRFALLQFFVDHPLGLNCLTTEALSRLDHFRLLMPCVDGAHLIGQRWPRLRSAMCLHAVPASALCDETELERRHTRTSGEGRSDPMRTDVVIAGSIHSDQALATLKRSVPAPYAAACAQMVEWLVADPSASFEQVADVVLTPLGYRSGEWGLLSGLWPSVMAEVNRLRRVTLVESLQGLTTTVYGPSSWKPFCTGTIRYGGDVNYADLPSRLAQAQVCLAWGPTQFAHSFSERLLLSMAAGCATVTDDRMLTRRIFVPSDQPELVRLYSPRKPGAARAQIEQLLSTPTARLGMAFRARRAIQERHLWRHRVPLIMNVAHDALSETDDWSEAA
jgi:Glycosyl transferases group 1